MFIDTHVWRARVPTTHFMSPICSVPFYWILFSFLSLVVASRRRYELCVSTANARLRRIPNSKHIIFMDFYCFQIYLYLFFGDLCAKFGDEDYLLSVSSPLISHSIEEMECMCFPLCAAMKANASIPSARSSFKLLSAYTKLQRARVHRRMSRDGENSCRRWRRPLNTQLYLGASRGCRSMGWRERLMTEHKVKSTDRHTVRTCVTSVLHAS